MTDAALKLEDVPEEARPHFQKQLADMSSVEKKVKRFHLWMREETDLSAGTRRDYVKAAWAVFVNGQPAADVSDGQAMMKKFTVFREEMEQKGERSGK